MSVETNNVAADEHVVVHMIVNGEPYSAAASPRLLLSDFLRHELRLTGTHVGCEQGVCGACTVFLDGQIARSCLTFAVQADGAEITTVEGLGQGTDLDYVQQAFHEAHGLQCGFCTPGLLLTVHALLDENPDPSETEIREYLSGNVCRCTGYVGIVEAVKLAAKTRDERVGAPAGGSGS
jgi:aerobic-type carbon monoxide dehydrogenase small subunit (CoxS/CutS family)